MSTRVLNHTQRCTHGCREWSLILCLSILPPLYLSFCFQYYFFLFLIVGLDVLIFQSPKSRRTGENQVESGVSIIQKGPGDRSLCPCPWHMASLDSSPPTPHDQRVIPESAASLSTPKIYSEVRMCTDFFPCALLEGGAAVTRDMHE